MIIGRHTLWTLSLSLLSLPLATAAYSDTLSDLPAQLPKPTADSAAEQSKTITKPTEIDITNTKDEKAGIPSKYTIMPVARGQQVEVDSEMIGDTITNAKGEELGKLDRLIMDTKTRKVEYAMIAIGDTGELKAFPWSAFKVNKEKGNIVLNVTKEQLRPDLAAQDMSPDVKEVIARELKTLRQNEPKRVQREGLGVTQQPAAAGPMGEEQVGGAGPGGPRALPPADGPSGRSK